jgi:ABC-type sugar transport system ATPase subunit
MGAGNSRQFQSDKHRLLLSLSDQADGRMARLTIRNLRKRYASVRALDGVDLDIASGECMAVVGPSGCGKTTLLRIIAGLERASEGTISINDRAVDRLRPHKRGVAMLFQDFPLYPHMTVRQNIAFPLRMKHVIWADVVRSVDDVAAKMDIEPLLNRRPGEL